PRRDEPLHQGGITGDRVPLELLPHPQPHRQALAGGRSEGRGLDPEVVRQQRRSPQKPEQTTTEKTHRLSSSEGACRGGPVWPPLRNLPTGSEPHSARSASR